MFFPLKVSVFSDFPLTKRWMMFCQLNGGAALCLHAGDSVQLFSCVCLQNDSTMDALSFFRLHFNFRLQLYCPWGEIRLVTRLNIEQKHRPKHKTIKHIIKMTAYHKAWSTSSHPHLTLSSVVKMTSPSSPTDFLWKKNPEHLTVWCVRDKIISRSDRPQTVHSLLSKRIGQAWALPNPRQSSCSFRKAKE